MPPTLDEATTSYAKVLWTPVYPFNCLTTTQNLWLKDIAWKLKKEDSDNASTKTTQTEEISEEEWRELFNN